MLRVHAIWAGNRQSLYGQKLQNCGTLKDDASCTMIFLCLHLKFCSAYIYIYISSYRSSMIQATSLLIRSSITIFMLLRIRFS